MSDVSVVVPHLPERSEYLARCLRGVESQTFPPAAVHVQWDHRREGITVSRNRGLAAAQTEYVALCDDDDEWLPHHLEKLYLAAQRTGADLVYSMAAEMANHDALGRPFDPQRARRENFILPSSILVRRSAALAAGGFQCPHQKGGCHEQKDGCPYIQGGAPCCLFDELGLTNALMDRGAKIVHVPEVTLHWHNDHDGNTHKLWDAAAKQYRRIAPLGTADQQPRWEGRIQSWKHFRVSAVIANLDANSIEPLKVALLTLRHQTVRPYLIIVDTGSPPAICAQLEQLRGHDCEVHFLRCHGYRNSSEPVSIALDLAHGVCQTEYLFHTHSDVFLNRRDFLAWLIERCHASCPVVGYEMSPRSGTEEWRGTPSHTATMLHMPTMDTIGASWSMRRWWRVMGRENNGSVGWPDTESMLGVALKRAGITPWFVTPETCPGAKLEENYNPLWSDANLTHVRSYAGSAVYAGEYHAGAQPVMAQAMAAARQRVARWQRGEP